MYFSSWGELDVYSPTPNSEPLVYMDGVSLAMTLPCQLTWVQALVGGLGRAVTSWLYLIAWGEKVGCGPQ